MRFKFKTVILSIIFVISSLSIVTAAQNTITITTIALENNKEDEIKLYIPEIKGFEAAEKINQQIYNMLKEEVTNINNVVDNLKELRYKGSSLYASLNSTYDYSLNGNILSVWVNMSNYTGGAHGLYWIASYTVNTQTNDIYKFKDLFKESSDYENVIKQAIKNEISSHEDEYFSGALKTIDEYKDFNFYIDGNIVKVYFPLYEIAPYAGGIKTFSFTATKLKNILKSDIYNSIVNAKPLGSVRLDGKDVNIKNSIYKSVNSSVYVPLKETAELLGHKVSWNQTGTLVDGRMLSKKVRTEIKNTVVYVPIDYFVLEFNDVLIYSIEETPILRMFKKPKHQSEFYKELI